MAERKLALTASGVCSNAAGYYKGCVVTTALGAGAITIYDNTSASGTVIDVIPASAAAGTKSVPPEPIKCSIGIYAAFASTGTALMLFD